MKHTKEVTGKLDEWYSEEVWGDYMIVWGRVYGDTKKRFRDGFRIHTSYFPKRELKEGDVIQTKNSTYVLGKFFNLKEKDND